VAHCITSCLACILIRDVCFVAHVHLPFCFVNTFYQFLTHINLIAEVKIEALSFASWFGGSDSSWAPPKDTFALLKNMKAYRTGPATLASRAEGRVVPMDIGGPVESTIVYEEIEEPEEFEDYE